MIRICLTMLAASIMALSPCSPKQHELPVVEKDEFAWLLGAIVLHSSAPFEAFEVSEERKALLQNIQALHIEGAGSEVLNADFTHFNQFKCLIGKTEWAIDFSTKESIATDKNWDVCVDSLAESSIGGIEVWRRLADGSIDIVLQKQPKTTRKRKPSTMPTDNQEDVLLHSDRHVRSLVDFEIDATHGRINPNNRTLDVVPTGKTKTRREVFDELNLDESKITRFRNSPVHKVVFLTWQISPKYDITFMTARNSRKDGEIDLESLDRKIYGVRLSLSPK